MRVLKWPASYRVVACCPVGSTHVRQPTYPGEPKRVRDLLSRTAANLGADLFQGESEIWAHVGMWRI